MARGQQGNLSSTPRQPWLRALKCSSLFTACTLLPVTLFLAYYASAGGALSAVWLQTFVYPQRTYEFGSRLELLAHPLKVFFLAHRQDPSVYVATALFFVALALLVGRFGKPARYRSAGLAILLGLTYWDIEVLARILVFPFNFVLIAGAAAWAAYELWSTSDRGDVHVCRFAMAAFALANLYGGTIVGGGWGRITETMAGSFYAYGILVDVIDRSGGVNRFWERRIAWSKVAIVRTATAAAVLWGAVMLIDNRAFRPWLDFPLYRLNRTMQIKGAAGIIGFGPYVDDTEDVVRYARDILDTTGKRDIFVFPLNPMLYRLMEARNATIFDTLQSNPFLDEMIPTLLEQLEQSSPQLIVMQRRANHTLAAPLESARMWLSPDSVHAMRDFLREHMYKKTYESEFYEVYLHPDAPG